MKKLTVKDFILYNSPCINCNSPIVFKFGTAFSDSDIENFYEEHLYSPHIDGSILEIDLRINYSGTIKLKIDAKTNKFSTNSPRYLTKFLSEHKFFLESACSKCYTKLRSSALNFNIDYGFIYPTTTCVEYINLYNITETYNIHSLADKSEIIIYPAKNNQIDPQFINKPTYLSLPIMRLSKFKSKSDFIRKIKVCLLFS